MIKKAVLLTTTFILMLAITFSVFAGANPGDILGYYVKDERITAFVANTEAKTNYELDCQIGTRRPQAIETQLITEDPVSVETILMVDNSLSVRSEYREPIAVLLQNLVENHAENEHYTLTTFSDQIEYILNDSGDYETVKEQIKNIQYKDQETYLTDVLYELLEDISKDRREVFRRIIIVSDGVDNKSIGYTKEELKEKLDESPIPIYTVGCSAKNNDEQLKAMFSLSRLTHGEGFLLDDLEDITEFLKSVKETDYTIRADIIPVEEDFDGSQKAVQITFSTDAGTVQSSFRVNMPFADITETTAEEEQETEPVTAAESAETETEETVSDQTEEKQTENSGGFPATAILAAVIAVVIIIAAVFIARQKRKKRNTDEDDEELDDNPTVLVQDDDSPTVLIDDTDPTVLVEQMLILTSMSGETYSAELSHPVVVGRRKDCDICIPDNTVSRQQFEVRKVDETFWIRNLSDYGTEIDGVRIMGTHELHSGSFITMGKMTVKAEIR